MGLEGPPWWDYVHALREDIGSAMFILLIVNKARSWAVREKIIRELAWNDHNSEWHLQLSDILRTHRWSEAYGRELVTANDVAMSLDAMLG